MEEDPRSLYCVRNDLQCFHLSVCGRASSETANENTETVQSGSAEEAEELTATEAENDQSVDESQSEEPAVTTGDEIQRNR